MHSDHLNLPSTRNAIGRCLLAFLVLGSSAWVRAQFQQPTDDELKMTADPKAPGAAAVYLNRDISYDDVTHFETVYERIKILTEKGRETATISIPYERGAEKITDVQARTIHPDGSVISFTDKPLDQVDIKWKGYSVNHILFTLPSVEVGSILEYRVKLRLNEGSFFTPTWEIQRPFFVHMEHYSFRSARINGLRFTSRLRSGDKVVTDKDVFSLDISDVPPEYDEHWMPPLNTLSWRVVFYHSRFEKGADFWETQRSLWSSSLENFTKTTSKLKTALDEIVEPGDSEEMKATKIYSAVMKLENTDFIRAKSEAERKKDKLKDINNVEDVWTQQRGSGSQIALLYVALARAAGLKAWPMQVVNRDRAVFDIGYLSTYRMNDYIVIVELGGKEVYLDPGQKMCPFGLMHWKHSLASGFKLTKEGAVIAMTPASTFKNAVTKRSANLKLNDTGGITGTVTIDMSGQDALFWRQLRLDEDEDEVQKQFVEYMRNFIPDGLHIDFDHFLALEDYSANLDAVIKVSGSLGTLTGKRYILPGLFFESRAEHPFVEQEKRTIPVDVHYPKMDLDDVVYVFPADFKVESTPQETKVVWPDHAMLKINFIPKGETVNVERSMVYNYTILGASEYQDLRGFYQKVAAADQQQLVLTKSAAPKGN